MAWLGRLIRTALSKPRGLRPLPDDFTHMRQRAERLLSSWLNEPDNAKFLTVQFMHSDPRLSEHWNSVFYRQLQEALTATTGTERRRNIRKLILDHCETMVFADAYLKTDNPQRKACALFFWTSLLELPAEEVNPLLFKAASELCLMIFEKLEDEAYPESRGDDYIRAYLDAEAIVARTAVTALLSAERGEDELTSVAVYKKAKQMAEHVKNRALSGVPIVYSPSKA